MMSPYGTKVLCLLGLGVVLGAMAPGCGSPPVPITDSDRVAMVDVEWNELGGVHTFMATPCPQNAGSIVLTNSGETLATVDVTETSSQLDLYVIDPISGAATPFTGPVTLDTGEQLELQVRFNCTSTADVNTPLRVSVTPDGGTAETLDIPFALEIQGE